MKISEEQKNQFWTFSPSPKWLRLISFGFAVFNFIQIEMIVRLWNIQKSFKANFSLLIDFLILDGNSIVKLTFDLIFFIFDAHLQIFYSSNHCERVRQRDLAEDLEVVVRLMIIEKHMSLGEQISKLKTEKNHEHNNKSAMI